MAIACLCAGVSERKVVKAISRGATDLASIGAACGAGTCCGGCHDTLHSLVADHAPSRTHESVTPVHAPSGVRAALA